MTVLDYSFPQYLLAKQSVDDRALNRHVLTCLVNNLPGGELRVTEVGAGIGTMLTRLLRWGLLTSTVYTLVDELAENIRYAREYLPAWASENGLQKEWLAGGQLRVYDKVREVRVILEQADVFDYIKKKPCPADLLIAHAFLDLLPMPESLSGLFSLLRAGGLAWLTLNFDGVSSLEPMIEPALDQQIEQLYHQSMDQRPTGGDSQAGRHLFGHLAALQAEVLAAGASDWVVHAVQSIYPADEAYFLRFILHFFETSLGDHPALDGRFFDAWLARRQEQIELGQLVYIAHQMDFLVKPVGV